MSRTASLSRRERRFWICVLLTVAAIYATAAVAPQWSGALRSRGLLGGVFIAGTLLVWIAVVTQGLRARPRGAEIGVALGGAAVYLLVLVRISLPEERTHLIEYGVVAVFVYEALSARAQRKAWARPTAVAATGAIAITAVLGLGDELLQGLLPQRVFAWRDALFNLIASGMAVGTLVALGSARAWSASRRTASRK